jgi:hypothetical protein
MKTLVSALAVCILLTSCAYRAAQYPLQPGEKVIFNNAARAREYRQLSGNDPGNTNRVVEITRPCAVSCE